MIEIGEVTKARPERVTPRPLQQRLQWTAPLNLINQKITTLMGVTSVVPAERRDIECCAS